MGLIEVNDDFLSEKTKSLAHANKVVMDLIEGHLRGLIEGHLRDLLVAPAGNN